MKTKLLVGLGNPGAKYNETPHNVGFEFLDKFLHYVSFQGYYDISDWEYNKYLQAEVCTIKNQGNLMFILLKPFTYMNQSGVSVRAAVDKWGIIPKDQLILVHDDLDLKLGDFKIQFAKCPKNHKGIMSVHKMLGTVDFLRVRLGVDGRSQDSKIPGIDYVLMKYSSEDQQVLGYEINEAIKKLMNIEFN